MPRHRVPDQSEQPERPGRSEADAALTWPISRLVAAYRSGELSPVEVTTSALERIATTHERLRAFVNVCADEALADATASATAYRRGAASPLAGVPISVKDVFPVRGVPTMFGSLHHDPAPAPADGGPVRRLRAAGAVVLGTTNTAEFGQSATTENLLGPPCANPLDLTRTPGGSSGGAAASVAAGLVSAALGSDAGGSVRIPAAFCGLVGFKPTLGRCADEGGLRAMTEFSCPGPLARSVADTRLADGVLSGTVRARRAPARVVVAACRRPESHPVAPGVGAGFELAVRCLERLGHRVIDVELPLAGWREIFAPLVVAEEQHERAHLLSGRAPLTDYVRRALAAPAPSPEQLERARHALATYRHRISELFSTVGAILTPTTAVPAFELGRRPRQIDGRPVDSMWGAFPFTAPFNVAAVPALALPSGWDGHLPVSVQLVGPVHADGFVLDVAEELEEALALDAPAD